MGMAVADRSVLFRSISAAVALSVPLTIVAVVFGGIVWWVLAACVLGHTFRGCWAGTAGLIHACLLILAGIFLVVIGVNAGNARRGAACGLAMVAAMWLLISACLVWLGGSPVAMHNWWMAALGALGVVHGALGGVASSISWRGGLTGVLFWLATVYACADVGSLVGGANRSALQIAAMRWRGEIEGPTTMDWNDAIGMTKGACLGAAGGSAMAIAIALAASAHGLSFRRLPLGQRRDGTAATLGHVFDWVAAGLGSAIHCGYIQTWSSRWRIPCIAALVTGVAIFAAAFLCAAAKRQAAEQAQHEVMKEEQRKAAAALEELGAKLSYDGRGNVTFVDLENSRVTDADLALLAHFPKLGGLLLHQSKITPDGLVHLRPLNTLWLLHLENSLVTEASVDHLRCLTNLRVLRGIPDDGDYGQYSPHLRELLQREFFWIRY